MKVLLFVTLLLLASFTEIALAETTDIEYLSKSNFDSSQLKINDTLTSFDVVIPNTKAFREAAETGKVKLNLLGNEFDLELKETHIVSDSAKIVMENKTGIYFINAPHIDTYIGSVNGKDNSTISVAVADDVLVGIIRVENKTYVIDETNKKQDGKVIHVVYDLDAVKAMDLKENYICGVDEKEQSAADEVLTSSVSSEETISSSLLGSSITEVDILPCFDQDFEETYANPTAQIVSMINYVNTEYSHANVELKIYFFKRYGHLPDGTAQNIIDYFIEDIPPYRDMTGSDLAILFMARISLIML